MNQVRQFVSEVIEHFHKISWPDKESLTYLTIVVLFIALVSSVLLGAADFIFTKLVELATLR